MEEQEVNEYTFPVSHKAKTLAARPEVIIGGQKVTVEPQLLFQRLSVTTSTQTYKAKQEAFGFELCSYAPSLFDPRLFMRNGNKSELADALWKLAARDNVQVANVSVYTRKKMDSAMKQLNNASKSGMSSMVVLFFTEFLGVRKQ
jgi:hypothetical protein